MQIINLIASHLNNAERLGNFMMLLENIKSQIDYPHKIMLSASISHGDFIDRKKLSNILTLSNTQSWTYYLQVNAQTQFMHYRLLVESLHDCDPENTWILFSDDDDEWAENRLGVYQYMIDSIDVNELTNTTCVCYAPNANEKYTSYIGSYTDYCVKLKYVKLFFENCNERQLQNKFCDSYFVRFICNYGSGKLKRAFCANDHVLYNWITHDYAKTQPTNTNITNITNETLPQMLLHSFDLYMASYDDHCVKDWLAFCNTYTGGAISKGKLSKDLIKILIKLFLENSQNHIFNTNNLPIYN